MGRIETRITNDGSIGLYDSEIKDIYHSIFGAHTESVEKFILPTKFIEYAKEHNEVKILDFCYGIGYNTKNAINFAFKINENIKIVVDAIDNDSTVIFLSGLLKNNFIEDWVNFKIIEEIINQKNKFNNCDFLTIKNLDFEQFLIPSHLAYQINNEFNDNCTLMNEIFLILHNIYYQYVSNRFKNGSVLSLSENVSINFIIDDGKKAVQSLNNVYDFIFFDAFTPSLMPSLWTFELFSVLKKHLSTNGILATYSSALTVRAALIEAGFCVGKILDKQGKSIGTLAANSFKKIDTPLTEYDLGLLKTRAGVFYRDINFSLSNEAILSNYKKEKFNSPRQSSSSFIKQYRREK